MFTNEVSVWSNVFGVPAKCILGWPQCKAVVVFACENNVPARRTIKDLIDVFFWLLGKFYLAPDASNISAHSSGL